MRLKKTFDKIAIVRLKGRESELHFVGLSYDKREDRWDMRWHCGLSGYSPLKEDVTIVKEFEDYTDDIQIWEFEKQWMKENAPQPQKPCARLGVIAPNGDFYPCGYTCHRDLCDKLGVALYDESKTDWELQKEGWVILAGGAFFGLKKDNFYTPEQKETVLKIVEEIEFLQSQNPDIIWDDVLCDNPEGYSEQFWSTSPSHSWRGNYAEAMRESYEMYFDKEVYREKHVSELVVPLSVRLDAHPGD